MFQKEFNGLIALEGSSPLKVPTPFANGDDVNTQWIVMEWLETGQRSPGFWEKFGQDLATLHRNTDTEFGFTEANYIGSVIQLNDRCATWKEFFATQRILPLMMTALNQERCTKKDIEDAVLVCRKIDNLFPDEPPSLLHGDLWSGNFMVHNSGAAAIFDPAVYYGHREMDLAMTLLFGGFDDSFYSSYNEHFPLSPGWKERVKLSQLYPLLVHLVLFGGSYYQRVKEILHHYR